MVAKRPLNGTSKVNRQTDKHTDGHADRRTFRLTESIGPHHLIMSLLVSCLNFQFIFAKNDMSKNMRGGWSGFGIGKNEVPSISDYILMRSYPEFRPIL